MAILIESEEIIARSRDLTPTAPWPAGDERGMANAIGRGTWLRAAQHLAAPRAKCYELSHPISNTMPSSPFGKPLKFQARVTRGIKNSRHASNMEEILSGEPGAQGTHMDALGHFGALDASWNGADPFPADRVKYYGGHDQAAVKPDPAGMLAKLGIDKVGILPGDVLYIRTGWGVRWNDPDIEKVYYTQGPGLAYDAAHLAQEKGVVLVALDNPFTDAVRAGMLRGEAPIADDYPADLPFAVHHHLLTQAGIHQIQNAKLDELADDGVWTSCTIILPLRVQGGAGSPVRAVAIGVPQLESTA
jgi:kynurenine formamidase